MCRHAAAIDPRKVGGRRHGREVVAAHRAVDERAAQLAVVLHVRQACLLGGVALDALQVVGAHLVAEPAAAAVQHHHHLAEPEAHGGGRRLVEHLVHQLHLAVVVATAERANLREPT